MGEANLYRNHEENLWITKLENTLEIPNVLIDLMGTETELIKVVVDQTNKSWMLNIRSRGLVSRDSIQRIEKQLLEVTNIKIQFQIDYCFDHISLSQLCKDWDLLLEEICYLYEYARTWLWDVDWKVNENNLTLIISNAMGVHALTEKGFSQALSKRLSELLGKDIEVFLKENHKADMDTNQLKETYLSTVEIEVPKEMPRETNRKTTQKQNTVSAGAIKGRTISTRKEVLPLGKITEEEKEVVITGQVIELDIIQLKSERTLITFDVTDYSDSITVKAFAEKADNWYNQLEKEQWLKIRGPVRHDRYTQELTLFCNDINAVQPVFRQDNEEDKRIELHLHTKMSSLDAVTQVDKVIETAARWGHSAVAITDHGVLQAFPEAHNAGKKFGVKIIYGLEGYLVEDDWRKENKVQSYHIIILVKNQDGLKNLYKIVSESHLQHFYKKPLIPRSLLEEHRNGLLLGTACEAGELVRAYLKGEREELAKIAQWYDYVEIQPTANNLFLVRQGKVTEKDLQDMNCKLVDLADKLNKPVVATGDVHFLEPSDYIYRRILMAGKGYDDLEQPPLYFKTTDDMLREFSHLGKEKAMRVVVKEPQRITEMVDEVKPIPDDLYPPEIPGAEQDIINMANENAKELYGDPLPELVQARLERELDAIISNGFAVLYLIAHKLVKKSNEDGYLVGSRGSVGSSFVATMTGITEVNPLPPHYLCSCGYSEFINDGSVNSGVDLNNKNCPNCGNPLQKDGHDIPFEVFLGFKGDKVPDIDLNFSGEYQPQAHKFTEDLFGKDNVFRAGTIATVAERTAFGFVKNYFSDQNKVIKNAELNRLLKGITGVKRTTGQHPGGLMVVPKNLDVHKFTPLQRPADDTGSKTITTHFDYHAISSRLVKLDILGHDDPTVIKMLEDLTGIDAKKIPLDEPKVISLFSEVSALGISPKEIKSEVGTFGIPEFGTRFVRQMLLDTKPKQFSDLVRISGLSHGTDVWLNNAQDLVRSDTATISEVISTRDDIMVFLIYNKLSTDISFRIMEDVRKGKGLEPEYVEMMKKHGIPQWYIDSCNKIKYMFPKAHAVAYVTMAYRIAYFKVYYPEAFYAAFFTVRADEFDAQLIVQGPSVIRAKIEELESKANNITQKEKNLLTILEVALEMFCRGIKVLPVDLNKSHATKFLLTPEGLQVPFAGLQGVGDQVAKNISMARDIRPFSSIEDLKVRGKASRAIIDALKEHGTVNNLPESDQMVLF